MEENEETKKSCAFLKISKAPVAQEGTKSRKDIQAKAKAISKGPLAREKMRRQHANLKEWIQFLSSLLNDGVCATFTMKQNQQGI